MNIRTWCAAAALTLAVSSFLPAAGAQETKGVTVKLLGTVDLGPEIEGCSGQPLGEFHRDDPRRAAEFEVDLAQ